MIGKGTDHIADDLRSWSYESHTIYYIANATGILVARILHQRMDVERHPMTDD
ncbi:MAG: type II toxin-antitoxin system RelE/ParE family toxin [Burkholderiaceae bacterium]